MTQKGTDEVQPLRPNTTIDKQVDDSNTNTTKNDISNSEFQQKQEQQSISLSMVSNNPVDASVSTNRDNLQQMQDQTSSNNYSIPTQQQQQQQPPPPQQQQNSSTDPMHRNGNNYYQQSQQQHTPYYQQQPHHDHPISFDNNYSNTVNRNYLADGYPRHTNMNYMGPATTSQIPMYGGRYDPPPPTYPQLYNHQHPPVHVVVEEDDDEELLNLAAPKAAAWIAVGSMIALTAAATVRWLNGGDFHLLYPSQFDPQRQKKPVSSDNGKTAIDHHRNNRNNGDVFITHRNGYCQQNIDNDVDGSQMYPLEEGKEDELIEEEEEEEEEEAIAFEDDNDCQTLAATISSRRIVNNPIDKDDRLNNIHDKDDYVDDDYKDYYSNLLQNTRGNRNPSLETKWKNQYSETEVHPQTQPEEEVERVTTRNLLERILESVNRQEKIICHNRTMEETDEESNNNKNTNHPKKPSVPGKEITDESIQFLRQQQQQQQQQQPMQRLDAMETSSTVDTKPYWVLLEELQMDLTQLKEEIATTIRTQRMVPQPTNDYGTNCTGNTVETKDENNNTDAEDVIEVETTKDDTGMGVISTTTERREEDTVGQETNPTNAQQLLLSSGLLEKWEQTLTDFVQKIQHVVVPHVAIQKKATLPEPSIETSQPQQHVLQSMTVDHLSSNDDGNKSLGTNETTESATLPTYLDTSSLLCLEQPNNNKRTDDADSSNDLDWIVTQATQRVIHALTVLATDNNNNSKAFQTGMNVLYLYVSNLSKNPMIPRYRKIYTTNETYQNQVATLHGSYDFLLAVGFVVDATASTSVLEWDPTVTCSRFMMQQQQQEPTPMVDGQLSNEMDKDINSNSTIHTPAFVETKEVEACFVELLKKAASAVKALGKHNTINNVNGTGKDDEKKNNRLLEQQQIFQRTLLVSGLVLESKDAVAVSERQQEVVPNNATTTTNESVCTDGNEKEVVVGNPVTTSNANNPFPQIQQLQSSTQEQNQQQKQQTTTQYDDDVVNEDETSASEDTRKGSHKYQYDDTTTSIIVDEVWK